MSLAQKDKEMLSNPEIINKIMSQSIHELFFDPYADAADQVIKKAGEKRT